MEKFDKNWPPAYLVRRSKKAGRISLRVSDAHGLEVVLPEKARTGGLEELLERHRAWITRQLARRADRLARRDALHPASPFTPPAGFWLHGGELRVDLDIGRGKGGAAMQEIFAASPQAGTVVWPLAERRDDEMLGRLVVFIKSYAKLYLGSRLEDLSRLHSLHYSRAAFATQKSRWGSYAPDGTVRLNHKLVFLPPALSDCVILHELCHSIHPNHGPRFQTLMQESDSESSKKNSELLNANIWIPSWFL